MKSWKTLALAAALAGSAGLGAALAPAALAQTRTYRAAPRADVFTTGGGSRIGVSIRDLDESDKSKSTGVVIDGIDADGPASKAGLKAGDVVVEFDGERVRSARQFTRLVSETPEGRTVAAAVMRDGQRVSVNITPTASGDWFQVFSGDSLSALRRLDRLESPLKTWPTPPTPPKAPLPPAFERYFFSSGNQIGISISDLEPQLAEYFGTKDGVLVTSVTADSAAAKAGLKAGDVITGMNGTTVGSASDLRTRIRNLEGSEFTLEIMRDKRAMTLKGKLETPGERRRTTTRTIL